MFIECSDISLLFDIFSFLMFQDTVNIYNSHFKVAVYEYNFNLYRSLYSSFIFSLTVLLH